MDADVTGEELDRDVRRELTSLRAEAAESVAKHLVMTARLLDADADAAFAHAMAARGHAPRLAVVREAVGLAAYASGRFTEAVAELRAARRISGRDDHWPVLADCERALGRPEKALQMAAAPEVARLDRAGRIEMRIVAAGARADLGQLEAAVVTLQTPELNAVSTEPWLARLRCAYAEALADVGRLDESRDWFERAAEVDPEGLTPAAERLQELDGVTFLEDELDDDGAELGGESAVGGVAERTVDSAVESVLDSPLDTGGGSHGNGAVRAGAGSADEPAAGGAAATDDGPAPGGAADGADGDAADGGAGGRTGGSAEERAVGIAGESALGDGGASAAEDEGESAAEDEGESAVGDGGESAVGDAGESAVGDAGESASGAGGEDAAEEAATEGEAAEGRPVRPAHETLSLFSDLELAPPAQRPAPGPVRSPWEHGPARDSTGGEGGTSR